MMMMLFGFEGSEYENGCICFVFFYLFVCSPVFIYIIFKLFVMINSNISSS